MVADQGKMYAVDIVMCIDATGSMSKVIDDVKNGALQFHVDLQKELQALGKVISELRMKVVVFRDYYHDGDDSMIVSDFYSLPNDKEKYYSFVRNIRAEGGKCEPESGLEALAFAIKSDWSMGRKCRHIIVVWTDASAHELEKDAGSKPRHYPSDLPKDLNELTDLWYGQTMSKSGKRLLMFAPDAYPWTTIEEWAQSIHYASEAGNGCEEIDYNQILNYIAGSI